MSASNDELHWLAFRYVAGELTADEESRFEERLADDQAAREAVEEVAELSDAIRMTVDDFPTLPQRRSLIRRVSWVAATLAGLLLVALVYWWSPLSSDSKTEDTTAEVPSEPGVPAANDDEETSMAMAWSQLRAENADGLMASEVGKWVQSETAASEADFVPGGPATSEVPGWLLTAIESENESDEGGL